MARIPIYDGGAVQEEAIPVPQRQKALPVENFGGGQATELLNKSIVGFQEKIKQDADQVAVLDADRQLSDYESKRLYDPKDGALNKKGKDAFPVKETTMSALNEDVSNIEGKLSNNAQKAAFRRRYTDRLGEIGRTLDKHVGAEMSEFDKTNTQSFLDNRYEYAVKNFQDMSQVEKSLKESQQATIDYAGRNGKPQEWIDQKNLDASSKITLGVMNQMLDNDQYVDARDFYKENKEHFNAADAARAHDLIKAGTLKGESKAMAEDIFANSRNYKEARQKLSQSAKDNPELYDATEDRLTNLYAKQKQAKDYDDANRYESAFNIAEKNKSVDSIPVNLWNSLSGEDHIKIKKAINDPDNIAPNSDAYLNAKMMAATPETRKEFLESYPGKLRGAVTPTELKDIMTDWTGLKNKDADTTNKLDTYYTKDQLEKSMLLQAGIDISKINPGSSDAKILDQYRSYMSRVVAAKQKELGRQLNNEELRDEINAALVEGKTAKTLFWNTKPKRIFQLTGDEEQFVIPVDEIPKLDKTKIEQYLRSRKKPINDEAVMEMYSRFRRGLTYGR